MKIMIDLQSKIFSTKIKSIITIHNNKFSTLKRNL